MKNSESLSSLRQALQKMAEPSKADFAERFFKTRPGEYAHGDQFYGIRVPHLRTLSKIHRHFDFASLSELMASNMHEERFIALCILVLQFSKSSLAQQKEIYEFYVKHLSGVNNWDLVDVSAPHIVGAYLFEKSPQPLHVWAKSTNLWERRVAMVATFYFIRRGSFEQTQHIAHTLLSDPHDLIHKAVGWMLREVGKKDVNILKTFLQKRYRQMPRTMLRYAIEKFSENVRKDYLQGKV